MIDHSRRIVIIAAIAADGGIGRRGDLLFHLPADLRHFKELTMGSPIIMGRKTFESFPKGPLPGRRNIVVTRNLLYHHSGIEVAHSLQQAVALTDDSPDVFVIGGTEIYSQAIDIATHMELTFIDASVPDADTFFPEINPHVWTVENRSYNMVDPHTHVTFAFASLRRTDA